MIERGRQRYPDFPLFFGLEWNAAGGRHANVVFPHSSEEAAHAYALSRAHDRHVEGSDPDITRALQQLSQIDPAPVLFFNHPEPGDWSTQVLDQYLDPRHSVRIAIGLEAVHGHQAQPRGVRFDHDQYPGCAVGGLADHVYEKGLPLALLANSDFHVHKQAKEYDYPLGVFNHTRVGVAAAGSPDSNDILDAIRAGRTCACQGHWLDLIDFSISASGSPGSALIGDTWSCGAASRLTISLQATEALQSVDLIGRLSVEDTTSVVRQFGPQPVGPTNLIFEVPPAASGHLRLRVISRSHERPAPGQTAAKAFFTSAILLNSLTV